MEHHGEFEGTPFQKVHMDDPGIIELVYTWRRPSGTRVVSTKTVYDSKIISNQQFAENVQIALQKAVAQGLENGDNEVLVGKVIYNVQVRKGTVRTVVPMLSPQAIPEMQ